MIIYTPARFFLDSLRVSDQTYWGLTPGQYFSVVLLIVAMASWLYGLSMRKRELVSSRGARNAAE
jgi:prolipoprotein diacylglyceryltransferase